MSENIKLDGQSVTEILVAVNHPDETYPIVTISGIDFLNGLQYGIFHGRGELHIQDSSFSGNGIGIQSETRLMITNSQFQGNFDGIYNFGVLQVQDSEFTNNSRGLVTEGVYDLSLPGEATINNSVFNQNTQGAVYNQNGTLVVADTNFTSNTSDYGGAIYGVGISNEISRSAFVNNSATQNGGAILNGGNLTVLDSVFIGNTAGNDGGAMASYGGLLISNSTFSSNTAMRFGGGLAANTEAIVNNSTFYNNSANLGGGVYLFLEDFPLFRFANNTISYNTGGGIYDNGSDLEMFSNIVANSVTGFDCFSSTALAVTGSNNLIETDASSPNACGGVFVSADPLLGSLQDNGGSTETMALLPGSPAIDAGDDANCPAADQRGVARPQGSHCDIGAYEYEELTVPYLLSPTEGESVTSLRPEFDWSDLGGTTQYQLQVSKNAAFTQLVLNVTVKTGSVYTPTTDLPKNLTLYWRVRGKVGATYLPWSAVRSFTSANSPTTPSLVLPANNLLNKDYVPLFKWSAVTLPVGTDFLNYQLQVDDDPAFASPALDDTSITDRLIVQFQTVTPLAHNTKYYWRVRAVNTDGEVSNWSAVRYFRTRVDAPVLVSPNEGFEALSPRPSFDWDAPSGPAAITGYTIQISKNNTFTQLAHTGNPTSSNYTPTADLPKNLTLYWRVLTKGANGPSAYSTVRSFQSANSPSTPNLSLPANNALNTNYLPLFKWSAVTLPAGTTFQHYQLQVDDDPDFASPALDDTSITDHLIVQFQTVTPLAHNTKYYWRVRAVNTEGEVSNWSAVRYFRTIIEAPVLLTPADTSAVGTLQPTFDWTDAMGPGAVTGYTIQVSTTPTFASLKVNATTVASTYTPLTNLPSGTTLYWRVRINGANGPSPWSPTFSFITP